MPISVLSSCIKSSLITSGSSEAMVPSSGQVKPHWLYCSQIQMSMLKGGLPTLPCHCPGSAMPEDEDDEFSPPSKDRKTMAAWLGYVFRKSD